MPDTDLSDTQPNDAFDDTQPNPPEKSNSRRKISTWLPILVAVGLLAIGLLSGYASGMGLRTSTEKTIVNAQLADQFQLGQKAVEDGNYEVARLHFEAVLQKNPNYPGIKAAYADLLLKMQVIPTPTFSPTSEISPTPDLRGTDELLQNARDLLKAGDWNGAMAALDSLRKTAPEYHTTQVDGLYYTALYQRAFTEIRPADCKTTNLNAGIIDFTQAEHFGPLDNTANVLRTYSRLYIAGNSFWDQDWKQAQDLFAQVMAGLPALTDSSCMTATQRWREATLHVAEDLAQAGDMCGAAEQYDAAFNVSSPENEQYYPAATQAWDECNGNNNQGQTAETPTLETPVTPVETPTPTLEPTQGNTETPTNG